MPPKSASSKSATVEKLQSICQPGFVKDSKKKKETLMKKLKTALSTMKATPQGLTMPQMDELQIFANEVAVTDLMENKDREIKLLVGECLVQLLRLFAPEDRFSTKQVLAIYRLFVDLLNSLSQSGDEYNQAFTILEIVAQCACFIQLLDMDEPGEDMLESLISRLLHVVMPAHHTKVKDYIVSIITQTIRESTNIRNSFLELLFSYLVEPAQSESPAAYSIVQRVLRDNSEKLEETCAVFLKALLAGKMTRSELSESKLDLVFEINNAAPELVGKFMPTLTEEILVDDVDTREKYVTLLGRMFASNSEMVSSYQHIWHELLGRFLDSAPAVRLAMVKWSREMLSKCSESTAQQLHPHFKERLLDPDDKVRKESVIGLCAAAEANPSAISDELLQDVGGRCLDKKPAVRKEAVRALCSLYTALGKRSAGERERFNWIPTTVLNTYTKLPEEDAVFRFAVEKHLDEDLLPKSGTAVVRGRVLADIYSQLNNSARETVHRMLADKKMTQDVLNAYLSARSDKSEQAAEQLEVAMRRLASIQDPTQGSAMDHIQVIQALKDNKVFKNLAVVASSTSKYSDIVKARDDIRASLKVANAARSLEFLDPIMLRASMNLINVENVNDLFKYTRELLKADNVDDAVLVLSLLEVVSREFPKVLSGCLDNVVALLQEDNKELLDRAVVMMVHLADLLPKAMLSGADATLRQMCIDGTTKQSKAVVQLLAKVNAKQSLELLMTDLMDNLGPQASKIETVLVALGQIAQRVNTLYMDHSRHINTFVTQDLLNVKQRTGKGVSIFTSEQKAAGLKLLTRSLLSLPNSDNSFEIAKPVVRLLCHILSKEGNLYKDDVPRESECNLLYMTAVSCLLRLARIPHIEKIFTAEDYHLIAFSTQAESYAVRDHVLRKLIKGLCVRWLQPKYLPLFAFYVNDPEKELANKAKNSFIMATQQRRKILKQRGIPITSAQASLILPEYGATSLVHLLAHHKNFDADREDSFKETSKYLSHFLDVLISGTDNFAFLATLFESIKLAEDVMGSSDAVYQVTEIAMIILKNKSLGRHTVPITLPKTYLPISLYRARPDGQKPQIGTSYLPEGFTLEKATPKKLSISSPAKGKRRAGDSDDEDQQTDKPVTSPTRLNASRSAKRLASMMDEESGKESESEIEAATVPKKSPAKKEKKDTAQKTKTKGKGKQTTMKSFVQPEIVAEEEPEEAAPVKKGRTKKSAEPSSSAKVTKKAPTTAIEAEEKPSKKTKSAPATERTPVSSPRRSRPASTPVPFEDTGAGVGFSTPRQPLTPAVDLDHLRQAGGVSRTRGVPAEKPDTKTTATGKRKAEPVEKEAASKKGKGKATKSASPPLSPVRAIEPANDADLEPNPEWKGLKTSHRTSRRKAT